MSARRKLVAAWLLAVVVMALFVGLGFWQSHRAVEKQAMLDDAASVLAARRAQPLAAAADAVRGHGYDWASGVGEFAGTGALLLDNQQHAGRAGVRAYRIFLPEQGAPLLVDLGWLPLPGNRVMPEVPRPDGRIEVSGLLAPPPSPGLALGSGLVRSGDGWLLTRIDVDAITAATGISTAGMSRAGMSRAIAPRVLRLDPALPMGYTRDLELLPNTLPPEKHRGYSVQWFALALAVLVTALVLTLRRSKA